MITVSGRLVGQPQWGDLSQKAHRMAVLVQKHAILSFRKVEPDRDIKSRGDTSLKKLQQIFRVEGPLFLSNFRELGDRNSSIRIKNS
jgi:hypothetical protein